MSQEEPSKASSKCSECPVGAKAGGGSGRRKDVEREERGRKHEKAERGRKTRRDNKRKEKQ